jgi:hypothetical protein
MSTPQPWPMGIHRREREHGIEFEIAFAEAIPAPERWRCHELDRHDGQERGTEPITWQTFMCMSGEYIDRWGYEEAQRYVTAVIDGRDSERALLPFADLVENLKLRFGWRGPVCLGAMLAAELAVTGRGR